MLTERADTHANQSTAHARRGGRRFAAYRTAASACVVATLHRAYLRLEPTRAVASIEAVKRSGCRVAESTRAQRRPNVRSCMEQAAGTSGIWDPAKLVPCRGRRDSS